MVVSFDLPADQISVVAGTVTSALGASVTINADGSVSYDPRDVVEIQRLCVISALMAATLIAGEQYGLSEMLKQAGAVEGLRVALVSDTVELRASHEYVGVLAKQRGIEVRSFHDEAKALKWLLGASEPQ